MDRDEHYNRAPKCPFFSLISSKPAPKRAGRSKAARSSKASRLSLQSVATGISDLTSLADVTADIDDSVLTTASNMTTASKASKKPAKGKKAATSRPRKTRAKKNDVVEVHEDGPEPERQQDEDAVPAPPSKPARGQKRASDELEDFALTNAEAPVAKKRATKARKVRGSNATEVSMADTEMTDVPEPVKKSAAKKTTRKASGSRKVSGRSTRKGSVSTVASTASPPPQMPDDDELDRQLQADLDRPLDEDEDIPMDADPETRKAFATRKDNGLGAVSQEDLAHTARTDFAVSNVDPPRPTDETAQVEMQATQGEVDVDVQKQAPELPELKVPKKGRKAGTRKVSKQTTKKANEVAEPIAEQLKSRITADAEEPDEIAEADVSFASTGTVKRTSVGRASLGVASLPRASLDSDASTATTKAPAKRGRPPKKKIEEIQVEEPAESAVPLTSVVYPTLEAMEADDEPSSKPVQKAEKKANTARPRGRPPKSSKSSDDSSEKPAIVKESIEPELKSEPVVQTEVEVESASIQEKFSSASGSPRVARKPVPAPKDSPFAIQRKAIGSAPVTSPQAIASPQTPGHHTTPAQSAKQATISPSPSPQASDAENQPPSSKPSTNSSKGKRMALGELPVATPARQTSPSKQQQQNVAGLKSSEPWTAVDLDLIFEGENGAAERFFAEGGELSGTERSMTVEAWIYYNAGRAEQKLKSECEAMVTTFEREGTRAMKALEGLVVEG